jgi:hypothetical protein
MNGQTEAGPIYGMVLKDSGPDFSNSPVLCLYLWLDFSVKNDTQQIRKSVAEKLGLYSLSRHVGNYKADR